MTDIPATEVVLLGEDELLLADFSAFLRQRAEAEGIANIGVDGPNLNAGSLQSWWDIAVALDVKDIPVDILCSLVATALWEAFRKRHAQPAAEPTTVKMAFRNGKKEAEVEIKSADADAIREMVLTVIERVYRK